MGTYCINKLIIEAAVTIWNCDTERSRSDYPLSTCQTDENWTTKKRVETVTTKSQEKQIQRQVSLKQGLLVAHIQ